MAKGRRPYRLPEPLTCDAGSIANGVTMDIVNKYIRKHEARMPRYNYLENLYKGFHDIFKEPEKEDWKPDNRLAVNFPRYITDTFTGYAYGVPIQESHDDDAMNELMQEFRRDNEITDHEAEMIKKCCVYGHAFEYLYQNESTRTKVTACNPKELFVVYDDSMNERALFAIRYGRHSTESKNKGALYGELLTPEEICHFDSGKFVDSQVNPFGRINVVEWRMNDERMGLFEPASGLIEAYNHTIAEKANDIDAFAEAYLAIIGNEVDEEGIHKIRDNRIINLYGTDDASQLLVQFLQKPTADGTQENLLNRLENLIYQTCMVANISDESFGSATSGTALAYKLQAMSNLALSFDRKIEKSLRKRYKLFCSLSTNVPDTYREAWRDVEITMSRNIPKNRLEEAQTAQALENIVSRETQLRLLSIVDDPKAEIEKMEDEQTRVQDVAINRIFQGADDE